MGTCNERKKTVSGKIIEIFFFMSNFFVFQEIESLDDIKKQIILGKTLSMPPDCTPYLFRIMVKCWKYEPCQRISFKEIIKNIMEMDNDEIFRKRFSARCFFSKINTWIFNLILKPMANKNLLSIHHLNHNFILHFNSTRNIF